MACSAQPVRVRCMSPSMVGEPTAEMVSAWTRMMSVIVMMARNFLPSPRSTTDGWRSRRTMRR
ncbi:MAG: hypothetical protein IPL32_16950 [Chloracidobacterium sp.]|nr:hypothetical protein [Chloracidobacterium sp.]